MTWYRVCQLDDLKDQAGSEFAIAGRVVAIFVHGETLSAVDGMCAHQGGPLAQGLLDGTCVTCPWHGWQYDVSTGCNLITGKQMLEKFSLEVRDQEVWIDLPE